MEEVYTCTVCGSTRNYKKKMDFPIKYMHCDYYEAMRMKNRGKEEDWS